MAAGDLNNHVLWDRPGHAANHANAVARFHNLGMVSAYHTDRQVADSKEREPTNYWNGRGLSDHVPLVIDIDL